MVETIVEDHGVDPISSELQFRSALARIGASVCVGVASLLLFIVVPILSVSVSVIAAIGLGALCYKVPILAIMLMLFGAMLGYIYQLGMPVAVIVGLSVFLFIISLLTTEPSSVLGVTGGAIAAMLMTTTYYYLAIPVLVAIPLFRGRGRYVGSGESILVFLALYLPLLVNFDLNHPSQEFPILFGSTPFDSKVPLSFVDVDVIFSKLNDSIISSTSAVHSYMSALNPYFPSFQAGEHFGSVLIILLGVALSFGTLAAFGISFLFDWLESREIRNKLINWVSPPLAILGSEILFLIPFSVMAAPFGYQNAFSPSLILGFVAGAILLGGTVALIEYWLRRRDLMVSFQSTYLELLPVIQDLAKSLTAQSQETYAVCSTIDILAEDFAIRKAQQDLSLSTDECGHMSLEVLQEKVNLFQEDEKQLDRASNDITLKMRRYYDDSRGKYSEYLTAFSEFGYSIGDPLGELSEASINTLERAKLVEEQRKINVLYQSASQRAVKIAEQIQEIIHAELDPNLKSIGIEIGRNYFNQSNYSETLETLIAEFATMDRIAIVSTAELGKKYTSDLNELRRILKESVIPTIDHLGDSVGVDHYSNMILAADNLPVSPVTIRLLIDLPVWLDKTRELANMVTGIAKELSARLAALEQTIEAKSPIGYNWGKNAYVQREINLLLSSYTTDEGWPLVSYRLSQIEKTLKIMEAAALLISQYALVREFMINYINIEFLVDQKLEIQNVVSDNELLVKPNYAQQYLRLYAENHHGQVFIEAGTGRLLKVGLSPNGRTT